MKKIAIVYYSQTGNTEAMAGVIEDYLKDKADVSVIDPAAFGPDDMDAFDGFAFGCPAMGAEVLEEDVYEPMFASVENSLNGKKLILFGSYGWGDGEWMRNWEERCRNAGALLACDPVIANEAPDAEAEENLRKAAEALIA